MTHSRLRTVAIAATLAALTPFAASAAERIWSESYSLRGDASISLENINGDIVIEAWDQDTVDLEATIQADSQQAVDEVTIEVESDGSSIEIATEYPERKGRTSRHEAASVDYRLRVPRGVGLLDVELVNGSLTMDGVSGKVDAEVVNGSLTARGLAGSADLATVNGALEVRFDRLDSDQSIDIESVNGPINVYLPASADASLSAETVHGEITSDFSLVRDDDRYVGKEASATLGAGGGRLDVENVNGAITIHRQ